MKVTRHPIKSGCKCGGNKGGYIFELSAPILKSYIPLFQQTGYKVSNIYTKVGVFFVERNGITASGPFGGSKLQVRCSSPACATLLDHLENTLINTDL
ncbi:MAG: hypothetical protein WC942_01220 [Clostridia bacterium]|jgi:hypothetical protein